MRYLADAINLRLNLLYPTRPEFSISKKAGEISSSQQFFVAAISSLSPHLLLKLEPQPLPFNAMKCVAMYFVTRRVANKSHSNDTSTAAFYFDILR